VSFNLFSSSSIRVVFGEIMEKKFFIGFGLVAMLSGIYMAVADNLFIGVCGAATGALIVYTNVRGR